MSTTVTYKGQTLTTVENQTKTLQTAGTWVEGDFTLTDASLDISDTTATASDVAQGKVFYSNTGTRTTGTASGGVDELYKLAAGTITDADVDWSKVTGLKEGAFAACKNITVVENPTVYGIGENCFSGCSNLVSAEITSTKQLDIYAHNAFFNCPKLERVQFNFRNTAYINTVFGGNYMMNLSRNVNTAILTYSNSAHADKTLSLRYTIFYGANALRALVLKSDNLIISEMEASANTFGGIYSNPTESTIYVPSALIGTYQTATNWSALYDAGVTFAPIEGSIYDD